MTKWAMLTKWEERTGVHLFFADSLFPITVGRRCNICLAIKLGVLVDTGVS